MSRHAIAANAPEKRISLNSVLERLRASAALHTLLPPSWPEVVGRELYNKGDNKGRRSTSALTRGRLAKCVFM